MGQTIGQGNGVGPAAVLDAPQRQGMPGKERTAMIFLLITAALVAGAPLVAAVLVSVASVREDATKSLAGRPPGPLTSAARRLLRARVGGSGPAERPPGGEPLAGGRPSWRPQRASRSGPAPALRRPTGDDGAARSYDAWRRRRGSLLRRPGDTAGLARPPTALSIRRPAGS